MQIVGIDVGGTFTDVVALDPDTGTLRAAKAFTVRGDESKGVRACLDELGLGVEGLIRLVHGTTIGTNAILERRGAKTALLVTQGFRDLLEIGRTRRMAADTMFSLRFRRPPALVPRTLRYDVPERLLASGEILHKLDKRALYDIAKELKQSDVQAVAVCYLHSYVNPAHEIATGELLKGQLPSVAISLSHEVVSEYREFERLTTTMLNAYIRPLMEAYLTDLENSLTKSGAPCRLFVMASSGGIMSATRAKLFPVQTVLSGPAGGVSASILVGRASGLCNLITCDMGGTSTDVTMIRDLRPRIAVDNVLDGLPLKVPQVDINTVGAGGGSIAEIDSYGQLRVGPRSAGANPGPICYGRGGKDVTVTDANLMMQRLALRKALGGKISPQLEAVRPAIRMLAKRLGVDDEFKMAAGIVKIAITKMVASIREISISRGYDPRECVLVAFGGAGPMHAAEVADELHIPSVLVPAFAGNFSALGLLTSDIRHDLVETLLEHNKPEAMPRVAAAISRMRKEARARLLAEGFSDDVIHYSASAEMRYRGQAFEVSIPITKENCGGDLPDSALLMAAFHRIYASLYGHANKDQETEIVNVRLVGAAQTIKPAIKNPTASGEALIGRRMVYFDQKMKDVPIYDRELLVGDEVFTGPAIIEESSSTTVVPPRWGFRRDEFDSLRLERLT
jgi:N-methylhydantoinase A